MTNGSKVLIYLSYLLFLKDLLLQVLQKERYQSQINQNSQRQNLNNHVAQIKTLKED